MKQVLLNVPEKEYDFFMELVKKFNFKTTKVAEVSISEKDMKLVDERRKSAKKENSMTWEEADKKLKHKYGV